MLDMDDSHGRAQGGQLHAQISTHALRPSPGSYSKLSPRCFSGTLTRRSTFGTTTPDTKTMTHHDPHPSRRPPPRCQRLRSLSRRRGESASAVLVGRWLGVLCIPSASPVPPSYVAITFLPSAMEACCADLLFYVYLQAAFEELPVERRLRLISCGHQSGLPEKDWENPEKVQVVSEDGSRY